MSMVKNMYITVSWYRDLEGVNGIKMKWRYDMSLFILGMWFREYCWDIYEVKRMFWRIWDVWLGIECV